MNYFRRFIPNFVRHREEVVTRPFKTLEELLTFEEVQHFVISDFSHFAKKEGGFLVAVYKNGEIWTVGTISGPEVNGLGIRELYNGEGTTEVLQ